MTTGSWIMLAGLAALLPASAAARAPASAVVGGDTVRYKGAVVHLWGIDAPELGQTCSDGWQAGKMAADHLASLVHDRKLVCNPEKWPSAPAKAFAVCRADGKDLSVAMAEAGLAWSYTAQTEETIRCRSRTR